MSQQIRSWQRVAVIAAAIVTSSLAVARADDAEKPWNRSIALGLTVTGGNVDSVLFTGDIQGNKLWTSDELRLDLNGAYGKTSGKISSERLEGLAQYKHLFTERFYGMFVADALHDGTADLAYRITLSPGIGFYLIKAEKTRWCLEAGPGLQIEKYNSLSDQEYLAVRASERFEHQFNDAVKVWQETDYIAQADRFQNYHINSEAGIEAALNKTLSLRVMGQHRYSNEPAAGFKRVDLLLTSAVAYKF